jgi:hypothetical protein
LKKRGRRRSSLNKAERIKKPDKRQKKGARIDIQPRF